MSWQPAYGGAVVALRDSAGRIVATIDGPHPAGYLLTVFTPERSASLHRTLEAAQDLGNFLHAGAAQDYRQGRWGNDVLSATTEPRSYCGG